jgi:hypothetical protein
MPTTPELDDADKAVLIAPLKQTIFGDPFPLSLWVQRLRGILAKLDPSWLLRPEPYPPLDRSANRARFWRGCEAHGGRGDARVAICVAIRVGTGGMSWPGLRAL